MRRRANCTAVYTETRSLLHGMSRQRTVSAQACRREHAVYMSALAEKYFRKNRDIGPRPSLSEKFRKEKNLELDEE
jgi:hypothetical protein